MDILIAVAPHTVQIDKQRKLLLDKAVRPYIVKSDENYEFNEEDDSVTTGDALRARHAMRKKAYRLLEEIICAMRKCEDSVDPIDHDLIEMVSSSFASSHCKHYSCKR